MMNLQELSNLIDKDEIAKMLEINPEVLEHFEKIYTSTSLTNEQEDISSRNYRPMDSTAELEDEEEIKSLEYWKNHISNMIERIVDELLLEHHCKIGNFTDISVDDLNAIPIEIRPQLTNKLVQKDIAVNSYSSLLYLYKSWKETGDVMYYHLFRQGLDILDLDGITYKIIDTNPNSMGYWFPDVSSATKSTFFKIPETKIIKVPLPILQLTRLDYRNINRTSFDIVNRFCMEAFELDVNKKYFIKTGTYSSKFDFRNAVVQGEQEVRELGEYLLFIHAYANKMASPLSQPSIYGVSTTTEWVVREFIEDVENNPTIYKGMPLRTEYRFFVDLDSKEILGVSPYWREDVMKKSFTTGEDNNHKKHDYIIYKMHERKLYKKYNNNIESVTEEVQKLISNMTIPGQWSIDVMQNGEDFYIIDMALAINSALNDVVEPGKLSLPIEDWLPKFTEENKNEYKNHICLGE